MLWSRLNRPNHEKWKPVANVGDSDDVAAYEQAADKLGIKIKISYPVPCVAGADFASGIGLKGVYLLREQAGQEHKLIREMFNQKRAMSR